MSLTLEQVRNFLTANSLLRTLDALEQEHATKPESPRLPMELEDRSGSPPVNQALNLSFGESDSSHPKEIKLELDPQASTRNNINFVLETQSHSLAKSTHSVKHAAEDIIHTKSDIALEKRKKSGFGDLNPFETGDEIDTPIDHKKSTAAVFEEDKFSFAAEGEGDEVPENDFDSFSKSHNNKFSKNENEECEEANIFGNSFDLNLGDRTNKAKAKKSGLTNAKSGNLFGADDNDRPKSELATDTGDVPPRPKNKMELFKSDVKSIDNDVIFGSELRAAAIKRASQGHNLLANNRSLAKQLFPSADSEEVFDPKQRSAATRKSEGARVDRRGSTQIHPDFADAGTVTSDRAIFCAEFGHSSTDRSPQTDETLLVSRPSCLLPNYFRHNPVERADQTNSNAFQLQPSRPLRANRRRDRSAAAETHH